MVYMSDGADVDLRLFWKLQVRTPFSP